MRTLFNCLVTLLAVRGKKYGGKYRNALAKQIIKGADLVAKKMIEENGKPGKVFAFSSDNIKILCVKLPENEDINLVSEGEGVQFRGLVTHGIKQATVVKYSSIKDILSFEELQKSVDHTIQANKNLTIQSTIISFTTTPKFLNVTRHIKIVLQNNQSSFLDPVWECVFIEPSVNDSKWSREGCELNEAQSSKEKVTCDCDHNTAFAILMHFSDVQLTKKHLKVLEYISIIGCSVSLLAIIFTLIMHVYFWKHVKSPRCIVLINLCIAIGFTNIFSIVEGVARSNPDFCKAIAVFLHFFLLSAFGWMLCEGILLYILLIRIFYCVHGKHIKIFSFIGWGIPLITVTISLAVTQSEGYGTDYYCWLSAKNELNLAFVLPACLVIFANTIVLIMVIRKVMNSHKVRQQENIEKVKKGVRATIVLLPILGLTWVFGLIAINDETVFFRYLFAIFDSAQGLLIFLFHCALNKQMREAVQKCSLIHFS
ncbi:adhesion G-protein coupled receptor D1-like [Xenia sp. Carnegie-2017]|uniref:adhesion G-protein coupled receptor D1-like n=1 Tax=Xenia sp. Carnegie-2017 TaxID=2897299 RepID=UPI001F048C70|nr:adhesion G-protein coupled receptor D1-like [Xenia sp. Carnegie-2017]